MRKQKQKKSFNSKLKILRKRLSPYRKIVPVNARRRLARSLYKLLRVRSPHREALKIAKSLTGVRPSQWLTAREAHSKLQRMNIKIQLRTVYRLSERTAYGGWQKFVINSLGETDLAKTGGVNNAVARIVVNCATRPTRFRIIPIKRRVSRNRQKT